MADRPRKLTNHLLSALSAAIKAGKAICNIYDQDFEIAYKADRSPLTLADQTSHNIIVSQLSDLSVDHLPILSEEGKNVIYDQRSGWKYFWMIDPLDGTKEFIKKNGEFTVNIAQIHQHRPILGVIYVPVKDILYFAVEGLGAYRMGGDNLLMLNTGRRFKSDQTDLLKTILNGSIKLTDNRQRFDNEDSKITIVGSRSHSTEELETFIENMRKKYAKVEFISAGSSLKLCLVAEGRADIYPRLGPTMEWDTAAGQAIVEQAGGSVLNFETNKPLRYNKEDLLNPWFIATTRTYLK